MFCADAAEPMCGGKELHRFKIKSTKFLSPYIDLAARTPHRIITDGISRLIRGVQAQVQKPDEITCGFCPVFFCHLMIRTTHDKELLVHAWACNNCKISGIREFYAFHGNPKELTDISLWKAALNSLDKLRGSYLTIVGKLRVMLLSSLAQFLYELAYRLTR